MCLRFDIFNKYMYLFWILFVRDGTKAMIQAQTEPLIDSWQELGGTTKKN